MLDKLEKSATKPPPSKTPFQRWVASISPDSSLALMETYSWPLFFRVATPPGVGVVLLQTLGIVAVWGVLRHEVPILFTNPHYHKPFVGELSHEGFYWTPAAFLFELLFNYTLYLPRRYFWNRRAARLRLEPKPLPAERILADPSVWPPAPKSP